MPRLTIPRLYRRYRAMRPFTDSEAWLLFKLAAFGEAIGWTLLIMGIVYREYLSDGNNAGVAIAGQLHGMLFLSYIAAAVILAPSLGWSFVRTIFAGLCSVPPYGSLLYELWAAHERAGQQAQALQATTTYHRILEAA